MFPNDYYIFTDTDVLFSRNFDFEKLKFNEHYPIASFGPHEYPFTWQEVNGVKVIFNEEKLMKYLNVPHRSMRYVWTCFYAFNQHCRDFLEEYTSICQNQYLLEKRKDYLPYSDETAFNICLWKRGATKNLGNAFVNTHRFDVVKDVEERKT
jgi:hypothetical protein